MANKNSTEESNYVVERIVDEQVNPTTGDIEYLLKWKGYSAAENTWEREEDLHCFDLKNLIKEYEEMRNNTGFSRGLEPEKILAATDTPGRLFYLMKWEGTDLADVVPAHEADIKCPNVVLKFYETHLVFRGPNAKKLKIPVDVNVDLSIGSHQSERRPLKKIYCKIEAGDGELAFIVKKKYKKEPEVMRYYFLKAFHSKMLIKYYAARLNWVPIPKDVGLPNFMGLSNKFDNAGPRRIDELPNLMAHFVLCYQYKESQP